MCKYIDVDEFCSFCSLVEETAAHLFCDCNITNKFWVDLSSYIFNPTNMTHSIILKDFFFFYENPKSLALEYIVNFYILCANIFIQKPKCLKFPLFSSFSC